MIKYSKRFVGKLILTLLTLLPILGYAQGENSVINTLKSEGKIYVVVLVICTIFAGIIAYLVYLDRKISKIEKNKN